VPPPALRNSTTWLERLFEDDSETVRRGVGRHREEELDNRYLDQERIYAGAPAHRAEDRPQTQVVLGGRPVFRADRRKSPFLVLTAAQARRVARFLAVADFDALWDFARAELLPRYGGATADARDVVRVRGGAPGAEGVLRTDGRVRGRGGEMAADLRRA
jgi:hypothetical protein